MTETIESVDVDRLLGSLNEPTCEWGTLGPTMSPCSAPPAWLCTPVPCACLPKYFCETHTECVRAELSRRRLMRGVPTCVACNAKIQGEEWVRV